MIKLIPLRIACLALLSLSITAQSADAATDADRDPAWAEAYKAGPMDASQTKAFMKQLAQYVFDHHMKKTSDSPQRGIVYEYFHVAKAGKPDQFIEGEALDSMHDGAWFGVAMVNAYRATKDPFYKEVLTQWQLPFYLRMLNHSDELFSAERDDGIKVGWEKGTEWLLIGREKGFVPYWWDDGASVSLEMVVRKTEKLNFPGRNELAGKPNPEKRLVGYSLGSSNHMAQDLAILLEQSWLLLHDSPDAADKKLAVEIAEAARNLADCRARHGTPNIPAVRAALGVTSSDAAIRKSLPTLTWKQLETARNDWRHATIEFKPDEQVRVPTFCDDQEYSYYTGVARDGAPSDTLAFRLVYDALTLPKLYRAYSDDIEAPPGVGIFEYPYFFVNGRPVDTRSQRKGPAGRPRPIGSRFGPQNMVVSGWALQALKAHPGLWNAAKKEITKPSYFPSENESQVRAALERELGGGLQTWQAILNAKGYIPTGIGAGGTGAGFPWDDLSDTGGYAHLISAASQWLLLLEDKTDWNMQQVPTALK
jgi:hypothetical protein